jgi:hypothetical protein
VGIRIDTKGGPVLPIYEPRMTAWRPSPKAVKRVILPCDRRSGSRVRIVQEGRVKRVEDDPIELLGLLDSLLLSDEERLPMEISPDFKLTKYILTFCTLRIRYLVQELRIQISHPPPQINDSDH